MLTKLDNRFKVRLDKANLSGCPQTIDNCKDSSERTYLPTDILSTQFTLSFIEEGLNIYNLGPSDSGKSYLAKALAVMAFFIHIMCYEHCESFLESLVALKQTDYPKYQKNVSY